MRNIKMILEYDGTRYKGYQKLDEKTLTIQGKMEEILSQITGEPITLIGCGRTDAGVHALNYVANFHTSSNLETDKMLNILNDKLPDDIAIKSMKDASERFHARYNIISKTYLYKIDNSVKKKVFERKYVSKVKDKLDINNMKSCAQIFVGNHDFQSFTTLKSKTKSTVRTINRIDIKENDGIIDIEINGDGFLWNMIRIIIGTLILAGKGKLSSRDVEDILNAKKRADAGPTAEAKALFLKDVEY